MTATHQPCELRHETDTLSFMGLSPIAGHDFPSKEESLARLPDELQAYVLDDNQKLQDEILQWDASKALIAAQSDSIGGVRDVTGISTQTTPDIVSSVPADIGEQIISLLILTDGTGVWVSCC